VSENKTCWNDSCWSVEIVFTLKKQGVSNVTMSQEMQGGMSRSSDTEFGFRILIRILGMDRYIQIR